MAATSAAWSAPPSMRTSLVSRSTLTATTPSTLVTSSVTATLQWSQVIPGTRYMVVMRESLELYTGWGYPQRTVPHTPGGLATLLPMGTTTDITRGYTSTKEQLQKRLKRVEGQVRGVEKMVEEDRYCIDVLTQISAIQAALDKVALGLMDDHARHCVIGGPSEVKEERTEELMAAVARLMRRG